MNETLNSLDPTDSESVSEASVSDEDRLPVPKRSRHSKSHHLPKKFKNQELLRSYTTFFKLFDFNKVNELSAPALERMEVRSGTCVEEALAKLKAQFSVEKNILFPAGRT